VVANSRRRHRALAVVGSSHEAVAIRAVADTHGLGSLAAAGTRIRSQAEEDVLPQVVAPHSRSAAAACGGVADDGSRTLVAVAGHSCHTLQVGADTPVEACSTDRMRPLGLAKPEAVDKPCRLRLLSQPGECRAPTTPCGCY